MTSPDRFKEWNEAMDKGGEAARQAKGEICERTWELVGNRTRAKLHQKPSLRRWEETDDLHSSLNLRLLGILDQGYRPKSDRHLFNLAAQMVSRLLIDSSRKFYGPEGLGKNHATDAVQRAGDSSNAGPLAAAADRYDNVTDLSMCAEFHEWIQSLPEKDGELFKLKYYLDMTNDEISTILECNEKTIRRNWRKLTELLTDEVAKHWPGAWPRAEMSV
jgi:RNA polymerase sigma factor (sigma-70 family)